MNKSVILALLVPMVLGRTALNGIYRDIEEIQKLNALTKKLQEQGQEFENPLQSTLSVSEDDVSFFVYNKENPEGEEVPLQQASQITLVSPFDPTLSTIFLIHGWHNDFNSTFNFLVGQALLEVTDVNIISVNWDDLADGLYLEAFSAVPHVGEYVGQFISNVSASYAYSLDKISIVAHSLGAHIAGIAGQATNGDLSSITGLDPAGPLYFESSPDDRLSEGDARYVRSIHTDSSFLGVAYNVGHSDFWPNGGTTQPGCILDITGNCSHRRSYFYFVESLTSNEFIAKECDGYTTYTNGECKRNSPAIMGGAFVNTTITGTYYLQTNSSAPYALGDIDL